jgi:ubiquitin carboxyl-terminal hydrolase 22/27/51
MFNNGQETTNRSVSYYKQILRGIFDTTPIVPQTSKTLDGLVVTSLTSNYLCLQCPMTCTEEDRIKHGNKKSHRFCTSSITRLLPGSELETFCGLTHAANPD